MPRKILIIIFVFIAIISTSIKAKAEDIDNQIYLYAKEINDSSIVFDAKVQVNIPKGEGYTYLIIPFSKTSQFEYKIDAPYNNEILSGFSNLGGEYLVFQIALRDYASILKISIKNAEIKYSKSIKIDEPNSFCFPYYKAIAEISNVYFGYPIIFIEKIYIEGINCVSSVPQKSTSSTQQTIIIDIKDYTENDVTIFFQVNKFNYIYIILFALFFLPACLTGLVFKDTPNSKKIQIIVLIAIILITILSIMFFLLYLFPNNLYKNEGIASALGAFYGACISSIITLIIKILK